MCHVVPRFWIVWLGITVAWVIRGGVAVGGPMTVDLNPTADAFVSAANAESNFGAAGALAVAASGLAKGEFQSVLRFDASSAASSFDAAFGPGQWSVQGVVLVLNAAYPGNAIFNSQSSGQFSASWMQNDSWLEGTGKPRDPTTDGIVFSTLSSFLSGSDRGLGTFSFDGSTSGTAEYSLTLEGELLADVSAGDPVSLRLFAADSGIGYLCNARDYTTPEYRPTLSITAVPEPSGIALLLTAACALFGSIRIRKTR